MKKYIILLRILCGGMIGAQVHPDEMRIPTFEELAADSFLGLSRRNYWFHAVMKDSKGIKTYMFILTFRCFRSRTASFKGKIFDPSGETYGQVYFPRWRKSVDTFLKKIVLKAQNSTKYAHVIITPNDYHITVGDSASPWSLELAFEREMTYFYNNGDSVMEPYPTYHISGFEDVCSGNGILIQQEDTMELFGVTHAEHFFEDKNIVDAFQQCGKELWMPFNLENIKGIFVVFCDRKDGGVLIDTNYYYVGNEFKISDIKRENDFLRYVMVDVVLDTSYIFRYDVIGRIGNEYCAQCKAFIEDSIYEEGLGWVENIKWDVGIMEEEVDKNLNQGLLHQNHPNPFILSTSIKYSITRKGRVELKIYNPAGQLVKTLVNEQQKAGTYKIKWDGKDEEGKPVPSGIYFVKLKVSDFSQTKKLLLLR